MHTICSEFHFRSEAIIEELKDKYEKRINGLVADLDTVKHSASIANAETLRVKMNTERHRKLMQTVFTKKVKELQQEVCFFSCICLE